MTLSKRIERTKGLIDPRKLVDPKRPKRHAFLAQIEESRREVASWPDAMKQTALAPAWMSPMDD
jgi:hypothetical protein